MHKETSARVSTIAARVLEWAKDPNDLDDQTLADIKSLAASALSQDEHAGQGQRTFLTHLKDERDDLDRRLVALNSFLSHNPGHPNPRHNRMLEEQSKLMSDLLAVLDERIADLTISERSAPPEDDPDMKIIESGGARHAE